MKLHPSVVEKIVNLAINYAGHSTNAKLIEEITKLDFTVYQKKTSDQQSVLVLTEDYIKALQGNTGR